MSCSDAGRVPRPSLTEPAYEQVATFFKVLAEPLRLKLLNALHDDELTVNQLMAATGGNQANVSKHLRMLLDAGLVARRKDGTSVYYAIADPIVFMLCEQVCDRQQAFLETRVSFFRDPAE